MGGSWRSAMVLSLAAAGLRTGLASVDEAVGTHVAPAQAVLTIQNVLYGLLACSLGLIFIKKLTQKKLKLPPGPRAWPIVGNWLQVGDSLNYCILTDMAKKYGGLYMLKMGRRNVVVISNAEIANEVLHTQGVEFGSRAPNMENDIFSGKGQDLIFSAYGEYWRKMRRAMTMSFFTNKAVQDSRFAWEDEINYVISDLLSRPEASTTGVVIRGRLQLMMYNVIYRMMLNRRFEKEDDELYLRVMAVNLECLILAQNSQCNFGDFIPILQPFLRKYLAHCKDLQGKRLDTFKKYFIDERKKLLSTRGADAGDKAAIDHILESEEKGEINIDNVLYIVVSIYNAGIYTILSPIDWGIAELINNPIIQKKVRDELDSVLGRGNLITEPDTTKTPYLTAVVKEILRLHMPIPLLVPHMNLRQAKLQGYDIPAESMVLVNAWWIANNPAHWDHPEEFKPERFLNSNIEAGGNFLPFGAGRRGCPGAVLAMPFLQLVLGRLVQTFDLQTSPGGDKIDMTTRVGQFSKTIMNDYTCVVKPRSD